MLVSGLRPMMVTIISVGVWEIDEIKDANHNNDDSKNDDGDDRGPLCENVGRRTKPGTIADLGTLHLFLCSGMVLM